MAEQRIESTRDADDRIDPGHDFIVKLRHDVERLHVLDDLRWAAGAGDDAADVRVLEAPRKGKLGQGAAKIAREWSKQSDLLELSPGRGCARPAIHSP